MPTKVIMPQMGESIFEGTITKWLKKLGDKIGRDEPLFEISTDKVDSEIPSPADGFLTQILVPEGKTVQINAVVAVIESESAITAEKTEETSQTAVRQEAQDASNQKPQPDVAAAPKSSALTAATGASRPDVTTVPEQKSAGTPAGSGRQAPGPQPTVSGSAAPSPALDIRTSPLVRRMAREHGIDLSRIAGTGLGGRITRDDVLKYVDNQTKAEVRPEAPIEAAAPPVVSMPFLEEEAHSAAATGQVVPVAAPITGAPAPFKGESETISMSPMRKAIAERMVLSKHTSAHVNTVFEVDMTAIARLRERYKDEFEKREGIKLTFTPFFVKVLVDTVREFPVLNASVSGESIVYKKAINVGIAVALESGLIVPVVKDAHLKSFTGLSLAIQDLAGRARTKKLKPEDVQNGTISITNPGIYGPLFGTPIINQPQVAILGVGGIAKRPVVIDDAIAIRSMVHLSLTFDHRVIDGAVADQFMAKMKATLQGWTKWTD